MAAGRSEQDIAAGLGDPARLARELRAEAGLRRWDQERSPSAAAGAVLAILSLGAIDLLILLPLLMVVCSLLFAFACVSAALAVAGVIVLLVSPFSIVGGGFVKMLLTGVGLTSARGVDRRPDGALRLDRPDQHPDPLRPLPPAADQAHHGLGETRHAQETSCRLRLRGPDQHRLLHPAGRAGRLPAEPERPWATGTWGDGWQGGDRRATVPATLARRSPATCPSPAAPGWRSPIRRTSPITQGDTPSFTITGPQDVIDQLQLNDGVLESRYGPGYGYNWNWNRRYNGRLTITIVSPNTHEFHLAGAPRS